MLEFVVLGQIPGTEIYIPFRFVAYAIGFIIFVAICYGVFSPFRQYKKQMQKIFDTAI